MLHYRLILHVWSTHGMIINDPANDNPDNGPMYHGGNRGTTSLNLLSGITNPSVDEDPNAIKSFTLWCTECKLTT